MPEYVWALGGASLLVVAGALPLPAAAQAVGRGLQVYLFLIGLLGLSELARAEGLFDWIADRALRGSRNSRARLFFLTYVAGVTVTALLSNDATAVVLTPAIFAALARTGAPPLPYLYACALVSNAASFLLPIGNPANLLVFAGGLPPLASWLGIFLVPSILALATTYAILRWIFRNDLRGTLDLRPRPGERPPGRSLAFVAVPGSCCLIVIAAALGKPIGTATFFCAVFSLAVVSFANRGIVARVARRIPWGIVPLVAGLFAIVGALDRTQALGLASQFFAACASAVWPLSNVAAGSAIALGDALLNNLPVGVIAAFALPGSLPHVVHAALIGVDLGPNISVTGSLATLLWLAALRRDGVSVTPLQFFRVGGATALPALLLALAAVR